MAQAKNPKSKNRQIKFPTGMRLWLNESNQLFSDPPEFAESFRKRNPHSTQHPNQTIGLEEFVRKLLTAEYKI